MSNAQGQVKQENQPDWIEQKHTGRFSALSYHLNAKVNPAYWAVVFTYYDGEWLYKFGKRIEGDFKREKCAIYLSAGHDCKSKGYRTEAKAKEKVLEHIKIIIASEKEQKKGVYGSDGRRYKNKKDMMMSERECGLFNGEKGSYRKPRELKPTEHYGFPTSECYAQGENSVSSVVHQPSGMVEPIFTVKFDKMDKYGQKHKHIEGLELSMDKQVAYIWLKIDGAPKERFHVNYNDAGTVGYARMVQSYAITARLTNVSITWGKKRDRRKVAMAYLVGCVDHGVFAGMLWYTASLRKLNKEREKKVNNKKAA